MGLLYSLGLRLSNFLIFFLAIVLLPGVPPKTTFPLKPFSVSPTRELKGSLALNAHLDKGERLLEDRLFGPEHILVRKNELYTGIHGGEVIKINADHITHVAKFGQPCEGIFEEARCGRPLGMAFDTITNGLVVADAYYGIWLVDLSNGKKKLLVSPDEVLDGTVQRKAKIFNGVAVDKAGNVYWTDSSSDFTIEDGVYTIFANPSGRLFYYDRSKNTSTVLLDELFFANGVALGPNEEFVIVAETGASRLLKYYLQGTKKGEKEVFVDGLPGIPDNLTPDEHGIWVPLIGSRDSEHPSLYAMFSEFPTIRLFILRFFAILETPFRMLNNAVPNSFSQKFLHFTGHFEAVAPFLPKRATIVRVDWNGNVVGALHGFDKSVGHVSHVAEVGEYLLLGSPFNRFIAKIKIPKGPQIKIQNVRYEGVNMEPILPSEAKKTQQTRPPTTTTTTKKPETPKPVPTTTPKPTTTTTTTKKPQTSTTTPKPTTTTTTKKPQTAATPKPTTTTRPPTTTTTTTPKPKPTTAKPNKAKEPETPKASAKPKKGKEPAPIVQEIKEDTTPPKPAKLKVIKKGGEQGEL